MSSSFTICPIHKTGEGCEVFWEFTIGQEVFKLVKCNKCDLVFYEPFPKIDYEYHTDSIASLKDYVHLNSNIDGLINNLLNNTPADNSSTMLEVGCGFGFTLDFAKRILNMDVVGYEPSLYGEIGAKELDLNIKRTYLTDEDVREKKIDIIFLSEVLEHIQDPFTFLSRLKKGLTEKGVLILTTPDYKKLQKDLTRPSELALLSPEAHVILYSEKSLNNILHEVGFKFVSLNSPDSLVAVCSMEEKKWKSFTNKNELIRKYYLNVLNSVTPATLTYVGILYRLLRNYVDFGDYKDANMLLKEYPFPLLPSFFEIGRVKTAEELNELTVSCGAMLFYYIGIMKLNYYSDFDFAASYFLACYLLCLKKLEFIPNSSVLEFEIYWLARYHYTKSLYFGGNYMQAAKEIKQIINFKRTTKNKFIPQPTEHLIEVATELRNNLMEHI
jgi:2-polyprenyl-3-methyl-5-hydroxy-6-metoxy-1,4-benzoquinol methylase